MKLFNKNKVKTLKENEVYLKCQECGIVVTTALKDNVKAYRRIYCFECIKNKGIVM